MADHQLLFTCPKCGWWAIGTHTSQEPVDREKLADAEFDVKCTAEDCGWTAQVQGRAASQNITSK
jgi:predicted  nucleic acid-binding Zn-ribbon protein